MHIGTFYPSKYLKASDLPGPVTVVIQAVKQEEIGEERQRKMTIYFQRANKALVCNKTNALLIAAVYGPDTDQWLGKPVQLYAAKVPFKGELKDAIRVRVPQAKPDIDVPFSAPSAPVAQAAPAAAVRAAAQAPLQPQSTAVFDDPGPERIDRGFGDEIPF